MLLEATQQGRIITVKYLLQSRNVDVDQTDEQGQTALIKACLLEDKLRTTRARLTRLFLNKGANVNCVDELGRNVLIWACLLDKTDVVDILVTRSLMDLDFSTFDREGNTALHYAVINGNSNLVTTIVRPMVRFGVCLDKRNNKGLTALLEAMKRDNRVCARVLMDNGASPNVVDPETLLNVHELGKSARNDDKPRDSTPVAGDMTSSEVMETGPRGKILKSTGNLDARCKGQKDISTSYVSSSLRRKVSSASLPMRTKNKQTYLDETSSARPWKRTDRNGEFVKLSTIETPRVGNARNFLDNPRKKIQFSAKRKNKIISFPEVLGQDLNTIVLKTDDQSSRSPPFVTPTDILKNPYDLRDFKSVLSLYGEQNLSTFRSGCSVPIITHEEFQNYLEAMVNAHKPVVPVNFVKPLESEFTEKDISPDCDLTPEKRFSVSNGFPPSLRYSVLRKDTRSRPKTVSPNHDHQSNQSVRECASKHALFRRTNTVPIIKPRLPNAGEAIPRRQSLSDPCSFS